MPYLQLQVCHHLACCKRMATPCYFRFVPESFRWLITKGRYTEAVAIINRVSQTNGRDAPDLTAIIEQAKLEKSLDATHHFTVIDMFRTKTNIIKSTAMLFIW